MRLRFSLNKIKIDPVCHIQMVRHAQEFENRHASGLLYGALYEDQAEVTNVMSLPDAQKMTKEELLMMQRRYEQHLSKYNLDTENLGWYYICYNRNFWDEVEMCKYYEKYINTSFLLVFDFKARLHGNNPYKAYRLKDQFATKDNYQWSDLANCQLQTCNPFIEIPVEVRKNELFQALMLFNKNSILRQLEANRKVDQLKKRTNIRTHVQDYIEGFEQQTELQKYLNDTYAQNLEKGKKLSEKDISFQEYSHYLGNALKLENHELFFKSYRQSLEKYKKFFQKVQ